MKKWLLILFISILVLFTSFWAVHFGLQQEARQQGMVPAPTLALDLRPILAAQIKKLVRERSDSLYHLSLQDIRIDIDRSELELTGAVLMPDTAVLSRLRKIAKAPAHVLKLHFPSLKINGIGLKDILNQKDIRLDTITLVRPVIELNRQEQPPSPNQKEEDSLALYRKILGPLNSFSVGLIRVRQATIIYKNLSGHKSSRLNDVEMLCTGLRVDSAAQYDPSRFFFAKEATLSFRNFVAPTANGLYVLRLGKVELSAARREMVLSRATFLPQYSRREFERKRHYIQEQYSVTVPRLRLSGLQWPALIREGILQAGTLEISNPEVRIFLDRSLPPSPTAAPGSPQVLLMQLPVPVLVSKIAARNLTIAYEEFNPAAGRTGKLVFDRIQALVTNLTNIPARIKKNGMVELHATGRVMNFLPFRADLNLNMSHYRQGNFSVLLRVQGGDGTLINPIMEPLGLARVDKGRIIEGSARINGNHQKASGLVSLLYEDLKVSALKKDQDGDRLKKRRLFSLIANAFVLKKANPLPGQPVRTEQSSRERKSSESFVNLVWKTMLMGILKTVGANTKMAD